MKCLRSVFITCMFFVMMYLLFLPRPAYAYLDPGPGSYILQMLIAAIFGGLFVLKLYFHKIKAFFKGLFSKGRDDGQFGE